jgi:hypothetical protein
VRFVANVCLLLALFAAAARGEELTPADNQLVSLAVDFCGALAGEQPNASVAAAQRVAGLRLSAARPLRDWTADEKSRSGIGAGLAIGLDDPLRFAGFSDDPAIYSTPGAMFAADESACSASGRPRADVYDAIGRRMNADARWKLTEQTDNPRTATWNRTTATGAEVNFMLFNVESVTFNRVVVKPPATTAAAIRPLVKSVADVCVNGVLNGTELDVAQFAPHFYSYRRGDKEGHAAQLRTFGALPRAMLNTASFRHEYYCELSFGTEGSGPVEQLRAVMAEVIGGFKGASPTSDREWRIRQRGKSHQVQASIEVDPRGLILLVIKTQGGHY